MPKTIKVFTTTPCTRCTTTKRWLTNRGIPFEVVDASADPALAESIKQLAADRGGKATMPLVEVHDSMEAEPIQWFDFRVDLLAKHCAA